ncbi:thiamine pyrophosphate-dependent enzyme [Kitasatospora sp. NPDC097691]|uniref:thiamine pyrophosphate-binding protein n=1 Tax=Kitasatospora sp. NPDC097691 TaxID=3157231 RepID=UPI0033339880
MADRSQWDTVAAVLADAGCSLVTGLPSDEPGLLDAAGRRPGLTALPVRDQRVAACAAIGHATASGRPAVVAVDSGPSFSNALTGLLEASSLCCPVVVVTTRIPVAGLGRGGFQQLDQATMAGPLVKWSVLVESAEQLRWALRRAVHLSVNGTPGVVLVEIAAEVLAGDPVDPAPTGEPVARVRSVADDASLERAAALLASASAPVVVAGGGAKAAGAQLRALAERLGAPVFTTASGRGVIDEEHPLAHGLVGLYAGPAALRILDAADVVLLVGSRLEETARTGWTGLDDKRFIQVDCESAVFSTVVEPAVPLLGDAALTLGRLGELAAAAGPVAPPCWAGPAEPALPWSDGPWSGEPWSDGSRSDGSRSDGSRSDGSRSDGPQQLTARHAFGALTQVFGRDLTLVQENGLHDIWGYQYPVLTVSDRTTLVVPGEQTMVGFGLGAALGAAVARPQRPTVLVCGDGAFEMSLAALPTIAENGYGLTVLVFDNRGFGWPRYLRDLDGAPTDVTRFPAPSHAAATVAALGGWTARPTTPAELVGALEEARRHNAEGRMALLTIGVDDGDVPTSVRRVFGSVVGAVVSTASGSPERP